MWEALGEVVAGALDSMHPVDHVTKRYYSPQCRVFSEEKYGEDRYGMNPGLCRACDALAPRIPKLEDECRKFGDADFHDKTDSSDWIPEEEDIEIDLRPQAPMVVEDHDAREVDAERYNEVQAESLDIPREVTSTKLDTPTESVKNPLIHFVNFYNFMTFDLSLS